MFLLFSTLLLCVLCQVITADSYQNNLIPYEHNYYYPDYAFNYSSPVYSTRQKRIFDEDIDLGNINIVVLVLCFFSYFMAFFYSRDVVQTVFHRFDSH